MDLLILFVWSFAAATVLPVASEISLILTIRNSEGWMVPVAVATLGNYLGACTTYLLARLAVTRITRTQSMRYQRGSALISRYGPPALLLSWAPILGDALVALAGAARMPFVRFSVWTFVGKAARYAVIAWLVMR